MVSSTSDGYMKKEVVLLLTNCKSVLEKIKNFTSISYTDRCHGITRNMARGFAFDIGIKGFPSGGEN